MPTVFLFPGQSSRHAQMLQAVCRYAPGVCGPLVEQASDTLGRDLASWYSGDSSGQFPNNQDVQVGVFLVNHLHLAVFQDAGLDAPISMGHSLGEYNHLVHIGALAFEEALRLVDRRGELYDRGPSGAMAAVFPLSLEELEPVLRRARVHGSLELACLNSPTQHVIGGERAAVDAALAILDEEFFIEGRVIEDRIPMHTPRFAPVGEALRPHLEAAPWMAPRRPWIPNVLGEPTDPTEELIVEQLVRHVSEPVQWCCSIVSVLARWPDAVFVEVGPRTVLHDLLSRHWVVRPRHHSSDSEAIRSTVSALSGEAVGAH